MMDIFVVKQVEKDGEKKSYWNKCGAAKECKDGSYNLYLDLFPGVSLNMRPRKEKQEAAGSQTGF